MNFSSVIESIIKDVNNGSTEPFIIYRDNDGEWHCDYTKNHLGESFGWVKAVKEQDHLALEYKGKDFSNGSFPSVYNAVLCDRIRAEYHIARASGKDTDDIHALICFFNDNVGGLSHEVTDYLAATNRPLAALEKMCPFNMTTNYEDWFYNESLAQDAVDYIENAVYDKLHGSGEITLTSEHCFENSRGEDFTGKLLIVKADTLRPEYRDSTSQIVMCTHGNGARPNAKGMSIFCEELASGNMAVYYRSEIEGVANMEKLPQWAKQKLEEQKAVKGNYPAADMKYQCVNHEQPGEHDIGGFSDKSAAKHNANECKTKGKSIRSRQSTQKTKTKGKKPSLLDKLSKAKAEALALNAGRKNKRKTKNAGDMEVN